MDIQNYGSQFIIIMSEGKINKETEFKILY